MIESTSVNGLQKLYDLNRMNESSSSSTTVADVTKSFGQYLNEALNSVSAQESEVHQKNSLYLAGQIDATELLISSEQAYLSLQLTSQIRNKVVEAYQEIMRIQV